MAVLPMVLPHRWGVALKAFADEHFFSRCVGEPGRLGALRLRRRRQEQAAEKNRKNVFAEKGHLAPPRLQATISGPRGSVNRGSLRPAGWACPMRHPAPAVSRPKERPAPPARQTPPWSGPPPPPTSPPVQTSPPPP